MPSFLPENVVVNPGNMLYSNLSFFINAQWFWKNYPHSVFFRCLFEDSGESDVELELGAPAHKIVFANPFDESQICNLVSSL